MEQGRSVSAKPSAVQIMGKSDLSLPWTPSEGEKRVFKGGRERET